MVGPPWLRIEEAAIQEVRELEAGNNGFDWHWLRIEEAAIQEERELEAGNNGFDWHCY